MYHVVGECSSGIDPLYNIAAHRNCAFAVHNMTAAPQNWLLPLISFAGRIPTPYVEPYAASKFALDGFFGGLRQQFAINNVDISVTMCYIGLTSESHDVA